MPAVQPMRVTMPGMEWNLSAGAVLRRRFWVCLSLALSIVGLGALFAVKPAEAASSSQARLSPRVIYFGDLDSARGKDFLNFLNRHFSKVGSGKLEAFRESMADGYDVVILDYGELKISNNRIQMPSKIVSREFRRPTVTIGATGALVSDRLRLKTGYL